MAYNPRTTYAMAYQLSEAIQSNYEKSSETSAGISAGR